MAQTVRGYGGLTMSDKLSVYPEADKELTVVETHTELERQVSRARQAVQSFSAKFLGSVRSGVNSVIKTEDKVEGT